MGKQLSRNTAITIAAAAIIAGVMIHNGTNDGRHSPSHATASSASYITAEDQALTDKLQPFISCVNTVDLRLQTVIPEYHQVVNILTQDSNASISQIFWGRFKIKPYEVDNQFTKDCVKGLQGAIAMSPADAGLDATGREYAETLEQLIPLMNDANAYYEHGDYKDDKMQKGKELDAKLSPLLDRLSASSVTLRELVRTNNRTLREHELSAMEKQDGKTFKWHTLNFMFQARVAIDDLDALASSDKLSAESIQPIEQRLQAALDEGRAYGAAHSGEKTRLGNRPYWFSMENDADFLLTEIKELRRAFSNHEDRDQLVSTFSQVGDRFNSLVKNYNMAARYDN